jgi:hypothetical protein
MKIVKHKLSLSVMNLDEIVQSDGSNENRRHGILFPNSMRTLICGPSNCGKSNVMLSLLFAENGLRFENVYVYSKSLYQPKYKYLHDVFKNLKEVGYYPYKENEEIESAKDAKENTVFIFDDVACDNQEKIREYFCMGRHKAIDTFYICQTYTRIPKHLIRDNANFIILFKQDDVNLKHVYQDHVGADMSFNKFKSLCAECWKNRYDFLVIDKDSDINRGRYRKNFDNIILNSST